MNPLPKIIINITALAAAMMVTTGCPIAMDWYPVTVNFYIEDIYGNDYLNPLSNSYIGHIIKLQYLGEEYTYEYIDYGQPQSEAQSEPTKTYMPCFSGLQISLNSLTGKYMAKFGELEGHADYDDDFIVVMPNGTQHTIHLDRKVGKLLIRASETWYLDGEETKTPITITYIW